MKVFDYLQDSHDSWSCLAQYAEIPKETILGSPNEKPDLRNLGFTMEILKACKNGKINKSRFDLIKYTNTIIHNEFLDEKEENKKRLSLMSKEELPAGCSCPMGYCTEDKLPLVTGENDKVLEEVSREQSLNELLAHKEEYKRKYGVNIEKLFLAVNEGDEKAIQKLGELKNKDQKMGTLLKYVFC